MEKVCKSLILLLLTANVCFAATRVSLSDLQSGGWDRYRGQVVEITTPLYLCGVYYDSLVLAPERLFVPEEHAVGLADGDSTVYRELLAANNAMRISLQAPLQAYKFRTGAVVRNLRARVVGTQRLHSGQTPRFTANRLRSRVPRLGKTDLTICSANIQNFFYDLGGYASRRTTRGQYELQRLKIATALRRMDADIYALCELEKGCRAPEALVSKMNSLAPKPVYDYVYTGATDGDTISVGFIYRVDKVEPCSIPLFAYADKQNIYAYRFMLQDWRCLKTGERFLISLNHLRSKRGDPAEANAKRMANVDSVLLSIDRAQMDERYRDEDVLLLGDYNSYSEEQPIQSFVRAGYADMLPAGDYSYVYDAQVGYLDRVFASPSMAAQITKVVPVHWNADASYSLGFKSKYNYKGRRIPSESPTRINRVLSRQAKKNLLFRYSDHDPILIGLRFSQVKH